MLKRLSKLEYSSGRRGWPNARRGRRYRLSRASFLAVKQSPPAWRVPLVFLGALLFAATLHLSGLARRAWAVGYPLPFRESLARNARLNGLPPSLVAALVHRESGFNVGARSYVGARGLMQLMPETARWTSEELENRSFRLEALNDSEMNVQLGTRYLSHLKATFGDHPVTYLAAYNAGPENVNHWLKEEQVLQEDEIPFPETRRYVESVLATQKVYQWLYPDLDTSKEMRSL